MNHRHDEVWQLGFQQFLEVCNVETHYFYDSHHELLNTPEVWKDKDLEAKIAVLRTSFRILSDYVFDFKRVLSFANRALEITNRLPKIEEELSLQVDEPAYVAFVCQVLTQLIKVSKRHLLKEMGAIPE